MGISQAVESGSPASSDDGQHHHINQSSGDKILKKDRDAAFNQFIPFHAMSLDKGLATSSRSFDTNTRSSDISTTPIPEAEEFPPTAVNGNVINESDSSPNKSVRNDHNILWEGMIFKNVQSLRHFKDSKSFCDHVLKTGELQLVDQHFREHILDYQAPLGGNGLHSSMSHCGLSKLKSSKSLARQLVNTELDPLTPPRMSRQQSFPRLNAVSDRHYSIMDEFIKTYFFKPGFELLAGEMPSDWIQNPKSRLFTEILGIKDDTDTNTEELRWFAIELNKLWKTLYRVVNKNVSNQPYRYSFIPLKHSEIFIPGGRFREIYYWDSFWIIQGLVTCGMIDSARKIAENLADLVNRFGFVPNGTRNYYLTRSQPPLLALMVDEIYQRTKDKEWLEAILPSLVKEYEYWSSAPVEVEIEAECDSENKHKLARYYSANTTPRPESYYEDRMTSLVESDKKQRGNIYKNIRCAAATGWDFSSRWQYDERGAFASKQIIPRTVTFMRKNQSSFHLSKLRNDSLSPKSELSAVFARRFSQDAQEFDEFAQERIQFDNEFSLAKLDTCNVIPVDLNIFLCKVEGALSRFYEDLNDVDSAEKYKSNQNTRIESILSVLWDDDTNQFRDWNYRYKCFGNINMASNFIPLWLKSEHEEFEQKRKLLVQSLLDSNLICHGGIVTTLYQTDEQWDYPNCWPPLNSMIIEGLYYFSDQKHLALKLATIWINNNYHSFKESKKMHEKYHCEHYGTGGGGEYKPQSGFGWTNGVCLRLMEIFGDAIDLNSCPVI